MMKLNHPFHLVSYSPWPLIASFSVMNFLISMLISFIKMNYYYFFFNTIILIIVMYQWWRDVIRESFYQGMHTKIIYNMLRFGMLLFIISEIFFFFGFFWAYFHMMLSPSIEIGSMWPPKGIKIFNPLDIPLLNTMILISSGMTVTWSHYSLLKNKIHETKISLFFTIMLGIIFSIMQLIEYTEAYYCINDSVYGSCFFLLTGFHGMHVLIGTIFLLINYIRIKNNLLNPIRHMGFEAAIWYWHFVDVVWLFLYMLLYYWIY